MKLTIGYLYPKHLNLYGDTGNVEILKKRAELRDFEVEVRNASVADSPKMIQELDLIFMGGGPDSSQKLMYKDLLENKKPYLEEFIYSGKVGLFICGSYQLLGNYYKSSDGSLLQGLGIFDLHTDHYGSEKQRCIGNVVCTLNNRLLGDPLFNKLNKVGDTLVGFENHGGRTFLKDLSVSLATPTLGFGNNGEDSTEGIYFNNCMGTYLHGPILARNPHLADYLIAKSLKIEDLKPLDDSLIISAHKKSKQLKQ